MVLDELALLIQCTLAVGIPGPSPNKFFLQAGKNEL